MANELKIRKVVRHGKLGDELYIGTNQGIGYTAYFRDFPQIVTQGETIKDAQTRLWNALYDVLQYFVKKEENK